MGEKKIAVMRLESISEVVVVKMILEGSTSGVGIVKKSNRGLRS